MDNFPHLWYNVSCIRMTMEAYALKIDLLGVSFDNVTLEEAVAAGVSLAQGPGTAYAVTPNPEFILEARKNPAFRSALAGAGLTIADGIGVVYAAKILGTPLKQKVPGIDFAAGLMAEMAQKGERLYLLGAKPGVAELAAANLAERYPGLILCGTHDGYFREGESGAVAGEIRTAGADVVFVCLGAPKQELWMEKYGQATGAHLLVGLGGSLDVFAGTVVRAPETWQKLGLEWLYRLFKEPWRWKRMIRLPLVLWYALLARLGGKKHG